MWPPLAARKTSSRYENSSLTRGCRGAPCWLQLKKKRNVIFLKIVSYPNENMPQLCIGGRGATTLALLSALSLPEPSELTFFFWWYVKYNVYVPPLATNIDDILRRIWEAFSHWLSVLPVVDTVSSCKTWNKNFKGCTTHVFKLEFYSFHFWHHMMILAYCFLISLHM